MPLRHPHPRELGATRFFARLGSFDLECPRCGKVFSIRRQNVRRLSAAALDGQDHTWNPATARFTCTGKDGCQKSYVLGMLAWEPPKGARATALPTDQVPMVHQLQELREQGRGHLMPNQNLGRMSTTNLAIIEDERPEGHDDDDDIE